LLPEGCTLPRTPSPTLPIPTAPPLHPADAAMERRSSLTLPEDLKPDCEAVLSAFKAYESGEDEAARNTLQSIALSSPFLEWKVLLRGLIAYSNGDDVRAVENWSRLNGERLPACLAEPIRLKIDAPFRAGLSEVQRGKLSKRAELLLDTPSLAAIASLKGELGRGRSLAEAFRRIETFAHRARHDDPALLQRIGRLFYRSILEHGEPPDMGKYRKVFGQPAEDPEFRKLQALKYEQMQHYAESNRHWIGYENWLSGNPLGWADEVLRRARASILHRVAANISRIEPGYEDVIESLFGGERASVRRSAEVSPHDPTVLWEKACELAPGWEPPASALFEHLLDESQFERAKQVVERFRRADPDSHWAAVGLSDLYIETGRPKEALTPRLEALRLNPLDKGDQMVAASLYLASARTELADGNLEEAEAFLERGSTLLREFQPNATAALSVVLARSNGQFEIADELQAKLEALPSFRLAAKYLLAVGAILAKWKPKLKKPVDAAFAEAVAGSVSPIEVGYALQSLSHHIAYGVDYRGLATHQKKLVARALATAKADAPLADFEKLVEALQLLKEWAPLQKLATACYSRFPDSPVFPLMIAMAIVEKSKGRARPYQVMRWIRLAKLNLDRSSDPRHQKLKEDLELLGGDLPIFDDFF